MSISVATVDMSLRDPGFCFMRKTGKTKEVLDIYHLKNPKKEKGVGRFAALELETHGLYSLMDDFERRVEVHKPDWIIVEFPSITQSAQAAIYIGMLWGAFKNYFTKPNFIAIDETALKVWSKSKRGDKKERVKEVVLERMHWICTNDNVIDAVGISLLFFDLIDEFTNV